MAARKTTGVLDQTVWEDTEYFCSFLSYFSKRINRFKQNKKGRWLHNMLHSLPLLRIRDLFSEEEKNQLVLNLFIDFLRSMRVHSEGLGGTQFIPVNVFEGELPLMLFSLPLRSKSISVLSRPTCHTGGTSFQSSLLPTRHLDSREDGVEWRLMWKTIRSVGCAESNIPTVRESLTRANCESNQGWEYWLLIYLTKHTQ